MTVPTVLEYHLFTIAYSYIVLVLNRHLFYDDVFSVNEYFFCELDANFRVN